MNFLEYFSLLLGRLEVVQNQHRSDGRKCAVGEWQERGITAHDIYILAGKSRSQIRGETSIVFETCYALRLPLQFLGRRAESCSEFQDMLAQRMIRQNPRQNLALRHPPPKRASTKPSFKTIHLVAKKTRLSIVR